MGAADVPPPQMLVVLDAEPIERVLFQFDSGVLFELFSECGTRNVQIAITDVQLWELRAHVADQVKGVWQVAKALKGGGGEKSIRKDSKAQSDGVPLPRLLRHKRLREALDALSAAADAISATFSEFIAAGHVRTIPTGHITAAQVMPKYFAQDPPFGPQGKKAEFPDAISIEAIKGVALAMTATKVVVVSGDRDWERAFEGVHAIAFFDNAAAALQHVRGLDNVAKAVQGLLVGKQTHLDELIAERFPELDFSLAGEWGTDVEDVEVSSSEVSRVNVAALQGCRATIEFVVQVSFTATGRYPEDNWSEWNPVIEYAHLESRVVLDGSAEIVLSHDLSEIEDIEDVSLNGPIVVSLDDAKEFTRRKRYTDHYDP